MEMTLGRLADWIIVISFFSFFGGAIGRIAAELIIILCEKLRDWRKRRRERKEKPVQ